MKLLMVMSRKIGMSLACYHVICLRRCTYMVIFKLTILVYTQLCPWHWLHTSSYRCLLLLIPWQKRYWVHFKKVLWSHLEFCLEDSASWVWLTVRPNICLWPSLLLCIAKNNMCRLFQYITGHLPATTSKIKELGLYMLNIFSFVKFIWISSIWFIIL